MLSILIVNWNTRELLQACLKSIQTNPPSGAYEVIIVDNHSEDQSNEMVRREFPAYKLIEPGNNTGYAAGNNLAFSAASGEFLLTLNPDTEVFETTLDEAMRVLKRTPRAGVLGAKQVDANGDIQASIRGFPTLLGFFGEITGLARLLPKTAFGSYRLIDFDYDEEQFAPQPMGTFLLFKAEALVRIGARGCPYDEQFPIFFNEVDLLKRLHDAGIATVYAPSVRLLHHGGMSTRQVRKSMIWESHRSMVRYFKKHSRGLERFFLPLASVVIYLGAFVRARGTHEGFRA